MTNEIKLVSIDKSAIEGKWVVGTVGGKHFEALLFDIASEDYGYQGGKISKLAIGKMSDEEYTAFDRGFWDGPKPTGDLGEKFEAVVAHYNA
jgi:hypothetical protein